MKRSADIRNGFSLLEVLVVLTISSILLTTLMASVIASSRVTNALNIQNSEASIRFFFDLQFDALISEIYERQHPDFVEPAVFEGERTEFSGVFANIFSAGQPVTQFSVYVQKQNDNLNRLRLKHDDQDDIWLETSGDITFLYIDDEGTKNETWPAEKKVADLGINSYGKVVLPAAIVLKIADATSSIEKVYVLKK